MGFIVFVKKKKGITKGGLVRTPGRRAFITNTKKEAEKLRKAALKRAVGKSKSAKTKKIFGSLIKIKKL